jgi:dephospho-CoA kinase
MDETLNIFSEAKNRFNVIGIIGMESSGKSEFFETVRMERFMSVTQLKSITSLLRQQVDNGNLSIVNKFAEYGFTVIDEHNKATWSDSLLEELWNLAMEDSNFYQECCNLSFPLMIKEIADRLKVINDSLPGIEPHNNVPIFIEFPLITGINYKDFVNEIVAIVRPTQYNDNVWYVKNKVSDTNRNLNQFSPYFLNSAEAIKFLMHRDEVWNTTDIHADILLENMTEENHYATQVLEYLSSIKQKITV